MTAQVIQRDRLGALTKIGQGGQGVVYGAPNVKTKFAASMVYKEYKTQALTEIDFTALAAMPALVEDSLPYSQAETLISMAAWPCAIVENNGTPTGFVMPAIPDQFVIPLTTVKGVTHTSAEFQHLLNHPSVLAARGININDAQRYTLLREAAAALAFLHKHGVCVGDISPKNLLFSLTPHEAVYFIDCDAMRINAVSALTQVETPGWDAPHGEELATVYTDTYKLGLLALRLLAGDHDTKNPGHLPPATPHLLRQIITDTLKNEPLSRPLPEAWTYVLGHAIEQAQHQQTTSTAASATPVSVPLDPPPIPVVRSRPTGHSAPPVSAPPPPFSAPPSLPPSGPSPSGPSPARKGVPPVVIVGVIIAVAAVALLIAHGIKQSRNSASTTTTQPTATFSPTATSTYVPPPPPPTTTTTTPPPTMYVVIVAGSDGSWASSNDYTSLDEATQSAMSRCQAMAANCKRVSWNSNGCSAFAWNGTQGWGGSGSTKEEAEQSALTNNHGGTIQVSLCT